MSNKTRYTDAELKEFRTLIEEKIQKEKDKLIHHWEEENIRVEKARWGRTAIIMGRKKVELPKTVDATEITLVEAKNYLGVGAKGKPKAKRKTKKT